MTATLTHLQRLEGASMQIVRDLGFTDADRIENIRRVDEVVRLMAPAR